MKRKTTDCKECGGPTTAYWRICRYCQGSVCCYSCGTWLERGDVEGGKHVKDARPPISFRDGQPVSRACGGPARRPVSLTRRSRDPQRQRLYRAEDLAWADIRQLDATLNPYLPADQAQEFARDVVAFLIGRPAPGVRLTVNKRRHGGIAFGASIEVGYSQPSRALVMHEAVHVGTREESQGYSNQAHGPEFAANYLKAVRRFCGLAAAEAMARRFLAGKVQFGAWR